MITNTAGLQITLRQIASFADMLEAMRRHSAETNSAQFPLIAEGYIHQIRALNAEALAYLSEQSEDPHEALPAAQPSVHQP